MYPVLFHIGPLVVPAYGFMAALGVLACLALLLRTAKSTGLNPNQLWNLCIVALFAAIVGSRLLLIALNWTVVRSHPAWLLGLAMVHHPLLAGVGSLCAVAAAIPYARKQCLPFLATADALAAPVCLGLAIEETGALLAGAGYGTETDVHWAVTYTHPLAARWSGAPLFVPVHPVQAYAAVGFLVIAIVLYAWTSRRRQSGDVVGIGLMAAGATIFLTEFWRAPEGRGSMLHDAINVPQVFAVALVLAGALILRQRGKPGGDGERGAGERALDIEVTHE